ncbi:MAG: hypothetical protein ACRDNF_06825 [Streptosporangiaceae bacterium]
MSVTLAGGWRSGHLGNRVREVRWQSALAGPDTPSRHTGRTAAARKRIHTHTGMSLWCTAQPETAPSHPATAASDRKAIQWT